jgi:hypothetical protein
MEYETEYQIIESLDADTLIARVVAEMAGGWRCQGGVAVVAVESITSPTRFGNSNETRSSQIRYSQAMVR